MNISVILIIPIGKLVLLVLMLPQEIALTIANAILALLII